MTSYAYDARSATPGYPGICRRPAARHAQEDSAAGSFCEGRTCGHQPVGPGSMTWGRSVMNRIRIRRAGARSGRPWPAAPSPDPPDDIVRATGARAASGTAPGNVGLGRPATVAGGPDGDPRGRDGPRRAGAHVGMHPAHQRGGAADRGRAAALGSVAGRLPARRQPPAGPGPGRNGPVTRAGGHGPRPRPRHCQRILQAHPELPDHHQPRREPSAPGTTHGPLRRGRHRARDAGHRRILRRRQRQPLRPDAVRRPSRRVACAADLDQPHRRNRRRTPDPR